MPFVEKFTRRYDEVVTEPMAKVKGFKEYYINSILDDTAGYAGTELHRRTIGFANVASGPMLTNLLTVAKASTNDLDVSDAILVYHGREPGSRSLLRWCMDEASLTNCPRHVHATIWECLSKSMRVVDLPGDVRDDILQFSRKGVLGDPMTAFEADRILCVHDPLYSKSLLRKQVASRILSLGDEVVTPLVKHYFEAFGKEVDK